MINLFTCSIDSIFDENRNDGIYIVGCLSDKTLIYLNDMESEKPEEIDFIIPPEHTWMNVSKTMDFIRDTCDEICHGDKNVKWRFQIKDFFNEKYNITICGKPRVDFGVLNLEADKYTQNIHFKLYDWEIEK